MLPDTVEELQALVLKQRELYSEAISKIACYAIDLGYNDLALGINQIRANYGLIDKPLPKNVVKIRGDQVLYDAIESLLEDGPKSIKYIVNKLNSNGAIIGRALQAMKNRNMVYASGNTNGAVWTLRENRNAKVS